MDEKSLLVGFSIGVVAGIVIMLLVNIWINQMLDKKKEYRVLRDKEGRIVGVEYG